MIDAMRYRTTLALLLFLALVVGRFGYAAENDSAATWAGVYAGAFVGSGQADNRLIDPVGFANWGHPGTVTRHEDSGFVGGVLIGRKFNLDGFSVRIELDGTIGGLESETDYLDPVDRDETAASEFQWVSTARVGIEKSIGPATVFATGGLALARIKNSVTDIDFTPDMPARLDSDDSFHDRSTETGWVVGLGIEVPLADTWAIRLEGLHLDFGKNDYRVNHSSNNPCGPGGPREPCLYQVENELDVLRLAITHRLGR